MTTELRDRVLDWKTKAVGHIQYEEAELGEFYKGNGVRFALEYWPTCTLRGRYRLLIERDSPEGDIDEMDQPMRYYHDKDRAKAEAEAFARALHGDCTPPQAA